MAVQSEYPARPRPSPSDRDVKSASATNPAIVKCRVGSLWSYSCETDEWTELQTPFGKQPVAALSADPLIVVCVDGAVLVLDGDEWTERTPLPGSRACEGP